MAAQSDIAASKMAGAMAEQYGRNEQFARDVLHRFRKFTGMRPRRLYETLLRVIAPDEMRRIVRVAPDMVLYINPLNDLGKNVLSDGGYELDSQSVFQRHIGRGDTVVDAGANEGYFTALFGTRVGPEGRVIAIEPQSRLRDIIEINCRLNGLENFHIFQNAIGGADGAETRIALYSALNSGMSSLVKRYNSTVGSEPVSFISLDRVMRVSGIARIDFMKIDVEGFEVEVVDSILENLRRGDVGKLYLDYHDAILRARGLSAEALHQRLTEIGATVLEGAERGLDGYVLYQVGPP